MQEKKNQGLNITCLLHMCYILDTLNIYVLLQKKRRSVRQLIIIFKIYNLRLQTFKKFLYR